MLPFDSCAADDADRMLNKVKSRLSDMCICVHVSLIFFLLIYIYTYIIYINIYPYRNKTQNDVSCTHVVACSWAILVRKRWPVPWFCNPRLIRILIPMHHYGHIHICMYIYVHLKRWRSCASNNLYFNIQCMRSIYNTVNPSYHTSKNKNPCICRYAICKSTCINKNMHVHYILYIWFYFIHGD